MSKFGGQTNVSIKGLEEIFNSPVLKGYRKQADGLANKILFTYERGMKKRVPVLTGTLRRSIYAYAKGFAKGYTATNTNYALKVYEKSSRPHYLERTVDETTVEVDKLIDKFVDSIL